MTAKCRNCGDDIDFKDKKDGSGKYPVNLNGSFHNCRNRPEQTKPQEGREKRTRWEGIKKVEEVKFRQVNEYLTNGWVILDRVERVVFVPQGNELKEGSESLYVVGMRV